MIDVQMRLPLGLGHRLRELVFARASHEVVAFCLVSHVAIGRTTVLLVRDVIALSEGDYVLDSRHGAAWRGSAMLPVLERATNEGLGIVLVHAHDFAQPARLSFDDLASARRLVPMFQARVPGRPHGSIVLGQGTAAGLVAMPGRDPQLVERVRVRWLGSSLVDWPAIVGDPTFDRDVFDRQALVVGEQARLAAARVAVAGLSGGGSPTVQGLAMAGIGTIIGIDPDHCEPSNGHKVVGMSPSDGKLKRPKTKVMQRLVRAIGNGTKFIGIEGRVPEPRTLEALITADVIVGCGDNLHLRSDLMEIAWRYSIPYIDEGVSIRALKSAANERRVSIGGNVHVFLPGGFCGWCCGFISDEKLRAERGGRDDRSYFQNKKGEAQVASFNATVAGAAVSEVLQLLTGYRGSTLDPAGLLVGDDLQRGLLKFDGGRGTFEEWGARRRPDCAFCADTLSAGAVFWSRAA